MDDRGSKRLSCQKEVKDTAVVDNVYGRIEKADIWTPYVGVFKYYEEY